jgi:hypothetical protein
MYNVGVYTLRLRKCQMNTWGLGSGRVAQRAASHWSSIAPRIDLAGGGSLAFFFSAKGARLDAAFANPFGWHPANAHENGTSSSATVLTQVNIQGYRYCRWLAYALYEDLAHG